MTNKPEENKETMAIQSTLVTLYTRAWSLCSVLFVTILVIITFSFQNSLTTITTTFNDVKTIIDSKPLHKLSELYLIRGDFKSTDTAKANFNYLIKLSDAVSLSQQMEAAIQATISISPLECSIYKSILGNKVSVLQTSSPRNECIEKTNQQQLQPPQETANSPLPPTDKFVQSHEKSIISFLQVEGEKNKIMPTPEGEVSLVKMSNDVLGDYGKFVTDALYIYSVRENLLIRMSLIGMWILPTLGGMLGATVALMRDTLEAGKNNTEIMPNFHLAIIRILAGGISGIVFSWFISPTAINNGMSSGLTSTSYALAFFAGYSIETLFLLLDKIRKNISGETSTPSPTRPGPPPGS